MAGLTDSKPNKPLSDAELKMQAIANYTADGGNTDTKPDNKFPTEIVDLPSKGLLYPTDNPLHQGQLEMKYMTAKEEDILTTQSYIKSGVVLDKLFKSLIIANGVGVKVNYTDLLVGDKNAVMIAARVLGYGKDYIVKITTPSGIEQEETLDLTSFDDRDWDTSKIIPGENRFEFTLPASGRVITYKVLSHKDNEGIDREIKSLRKIKDGYGSKQLTTRLIHTITSVDGDDSAGAIRSFVKGELLAIDSRALRDNMKLSNPDIDLTIELFDNESGEPFEASLPINANFFWPSV